MLFFRTLSGWMRLVKATKAFTSVSKESLDKFTFLDKRIAGSSEHLIFYGTGEKYINWPKFEDTWL